MKKQSSGAAPAGRGLGNRVLDWVDARTGARMLIDKALHEPIPGGARWAYVFGSGLLFIFLLQVVTGISLALYYTPTAETAHTSVAYITKQVEGGAFLRSLHSYGSSAMVVVLAMHFLQTFFYGSFKGRRELLWLSGAVLSLLVLGMGFTGYLLPWDQKAYFATAVGTNVAGQVPIIGTLLTRLLRGGESIGTLTISRFYVAHVFLIPASIFAFIGAHILLFRKAGPAGPVNEDPVTPRMLPEPFYPRQVLFDMGFALLIMAVLSALSYLRPVMLGPIANPSDSHFLPRPEWYYLPMFEWLKFWEGPSVVFGIVVIPGLVAGIFFLMPFLDRRLERQPWRRPIPVLSVAVVVLGMVALGVKSELDDRQGPIAAQLAQQRELERAYSVTPFEPYVEGAEKMNVDLPPGQGDPLVAEGKGVFTQRGCTGCHGQSGDGTSMAPSLVGVTKKYPGDQLPTLLRTLNPRMRAGNMPAVVANADEMNALVKYLSVLGTRAAAVRAVYKLETPSSSSANNPGSVLRASVASGRSTSVAGQDNSSNAAAGAEIFQEHGCFACHGQAGIGGKAPALAPMISKLDDTALQAVLQSPNERMRAGGMQPVEASKEELSELIKYLRSLRVPEARSTSSARVPAMRPQADRTEEHYEVAAFAPAPAPVKEPAFSTPPKAELAGISINAPSPGHQLFRSNGCFACHGANAQGTQMAPSLIGVSERFPGDKLTDLLRHPTHKMQEGGMPTIKLNDAQLEQLVDYLNTLKRDVNPVNEASLKIPAHPGSDPASPSPERNAAETSQTEYQVASVKIDDPLVRRGQVVFKKNACASCHGPAGQKGTIAAPALAGTASVLPESTLEGLLQHHSSRMMQGGMPLTNFSDRDRKAIVAYIRSIPSPVQ